jgi:hypothetical protein
MKDGVCGKWFKLEWISATLNFTRILYRWTPLSYMWYGYYWRDSSGVCLHLSQTLCTEVQIKKNVQKLQFISQRQRYENTILWEWFHLHLSCATVQRCERGWGGSVCTHITAEVSNPPPGLFWHREVSSLLAKEQEQWHIAWKELSLRLEAVCSAYVWWDSTTRRKFECGSSSLQWHTGAMGCRHQDCQCLK